MTMIPIIYSEQFLLHETGFLHPEQPERLTAIKGALQAAAWAEQLQWQLPTPISQRLTLTELQRVHTREYIEQVKAFSERGWGCFESTQTSSHSYEVASLAVSAWLDGVDAVLAIGNPAFVLARPPGHHALQDTGMGFCLFANAAIAALYALEQPGISRVAILDWDVHHGNGTQAAVENHPDIAFCSIHQSPGYPHTGTPDERGGYNNVLNLPIDPGSNLTDYQPLFEQKVLPFLSNFQPDLLIVSAGYDANQADMLSKINLQPADYSLFTTYCLQLTRRVVFGLEGGYELESLAQSVVATIERCLV